MNLNFRQQSVGETTYLVFDFDNNLAIDDFAMNMLARNRMTHIVQAQIVQINECRQGQFNITGMVRLNSKIARPLPKKEVLSIFNSILNAFEETDAYMMDMEHLLLDWDYIWLDGQNNCMLLYLPFDHGFSKDKIVFLQETVNRIQPDYQEKDPYLFDISNAFSRGAIRKLSDFREIIKKSSSIPQDEHKEEKKEEPIAVPQNGERQKQDTGAVFQGVKEKKEILDPKPAVKRSPAKIPVINIPGREPGTGDVSTETSRTVKEIEKKKSEKKGFFKIGFTKQNAKEVTIPGRSDGGNLKEPKPVKNDERSRQADMYESYEHTVIMQEPAKTQTDSSVTVMLEQAELPVQISAKLLRKQDGSVYQIDRNEVIIGSGTMADIHILNNSAVSRRHAKIICVNGSYYLQDQQSKNGSFINGRRLKAEIREPLYDGMTIRFANEDFEFIMPG